jgi:hypothetical protein
MFFLFLEKSFCALTPFTILPFNFFFMLPLSMLIVLKRMASSFNPFQ